MAISQYRSKRTNTGSRFKDWRKKIKTELGSLPTLTKIGKTKISTKRIQGGNLKSKILSAESANVYNEKTKKYVKVKLISVKDNPANRNYTRRNIITKGAIIETEKGDAKVMNRPGQEGIINAIFI